MAAASFLRECVRVEDDVSTGGLRKQLPVDLLRSADSWFIRCPRGNIAMMDEIGSALILLNWIRLVR